MASCSKPAKASSGRALRPSPSTVDAGGSLTARATDDIYITAPTSDIPVLGIYSETGGVYLDAVEGSIYDAITSDYAKIQANWIELQAGGTVGQGTIGTGDHSLDGTIGLDALHIDIPATSRQVGQTIAPFTGMGTLGALRVAAHGNIDVVQTDGEL